MKTLKLALGIAVGSLVGIGIVAADPLAAAVTGKKKDGNHEKLVFVTGSRIPQRVQVKAIGTNTTSPVRVYTRAEMDRSGQFTTQGILAQDPSVRILGGGSPGSH
jgi:outer membrane cobalamin receptor